MPRAYEVPGQGVLELTVPTEWREEVRRPPGLPPTITFTPSRGAAFHLQITALGSPRSEPGFNAPDKVRALVEGQGRKLLAQARERTLVVEPLGTGAVAGYFYSLIDKAPKPDEYPLLTQGAVGVGELLLTFTFLHRDRDAPEWRVARNMLGDARHTRR